KAAAADYPNLSNIERAIDVALEQPYLEINSFYRRNGSPETEEQAMQTLSYFDIMNRADRVKVPVLMSIGLMDKVTPPST
ncbi:acetylxylan esterase, partial [Bacillus vallismortis]|nr:acetylxylan esterase [Bacillus vallismortis]